MNSTEYIEKVRHLDWLKGIAKEYESRIEFLGNAGQELTLLAIHYSYHGPGTMQLNSHRSIDMAFIFAGFNDALRKLREEIAELEKELKTVIVQL